MGKSTKSSVVANDHDEDDYKAQLDADTLQRAAEIQQDTDRHQKASKHLEKRASAANAAHQNSRKQLEQKTKGRLKKVFGGGAADKQGGFQSESEREQGEMEKIVNTKE